LSDATREHQGSSSEEEKGRFHAGVR
jgi:hypothetical protein